MVSEFDFPKQLLPQFYVEEEGLLDTLMVLVESNKDTVNQPNSKPEPVLKPKKKEEKKQEDHKEEEVYFDCNVMNKFDGNIVFDKVNSNPPQKIDA